MPPSPASSRRSLSQEMRVENHKRGRSLEGGLPVQEKDDDLALFNEMQARERENFLLQSSDDFEDSFSSKLRHFADYKIGVSIPARGESSDLLSADGEKNDYEWLMTPPDTPLFPSLDDEPAPAHIPTRGRTRTQPIAISRSSTMEKSHRSSRGSASPSRSSLSPRSGNSMGQSRIKPSSAPHTSPISSIRSPTPSRRASPPPSKPSTPVPRSSSPTPRRMSTGSGASAGAAGVRGVSPQKVTRGNFASPKIKAWQANIPGFSCDVPPNLRTSLADRPASYVRGSSPASRNGRDSSSKGNRQSMSPAATRSVSSSHSHERDWFSSHSKGSIVSSGDDDVDSLQSVTVGSMDQSTPRKVDEYLNNNRSLAHSRRSPKISASAPKRSFDSVLRQMDNRKTPQNMFRPLLSSVPSTTFYVGKASSTHSMTSHNSSFTTSSNTSSDQGRSALPEPEGYYNQDDMVGESRKMICPDIQEEVFAFDKADEDELEGEIYGDIDRGHSAEGVLDYIEVSATHEPAQVRDDLSNAVNIGSTMLCSLCGCSYDATDAMEIEIKLCEECRVKENFHDAVFPETLAVGPGRPLAMPNSSPEGEDLDSLAIVVSKSQIVIVAEPKESRTHSLDHSSSVSYAEVKEEDVDNGEGVEQPNGGGDPPVRSTTCQDSEQFADHPSTHVTAAEGMGISLLLKRSSSSKGLVIQGRALAASNILPYDDLSYTRETSTSIRSSIRHGSFSSSSSIDLSSSRQTETRMLRQYSGKISDNENYRYEVRSQSVGSSLSGISSYSHQAIGLATTTSEVNFEGFTGELNNNLSSETAVASAEQLPGLEVVGAELAYSSSTRSVVPEEDNCDCGGNGRKSDANALHSSTRTDDAVRLDMKESFEDDMMASSDDFQETTKSGSYESLQENAMNEIDMKASSATSDYRGPMHEMSAANGTLPSTSEIEVHDYNQIVAGSALIDIPHDTNRAMDGLQEHPQKDTSASTPEPISSDKIVDVLGESTVTVECHGRNRTRSLTLEEATDTILFCSSIVHDLAYKAATIAMEKEREKEWEKEREKEDLDALEGFKPTVTIVGKSTQSDRKDHQSGRIISKRGIKPHPKPRQKPIDNYRKPISNKPENDENVDESLTRNVGLPPKFDSMKPPKLESKCNCTIM